MKYSTLALLMAVSAVSHVKATEDEETEELPGSAKDDINKDASTKAADDINQIDKDLDQLWQDKRKLKDGYEDKSQAEKEAYDGTLAEALRQRQEARDNRDSKEKTDAGYDAMSAEAQTIYNDGLLKWKKAVYEKCVDADNEDECVSGENAKRKSQEDKRTTDGYYSKSLNDRELDDKARIAEEQRTEGETQAAEDTEEGGSGGGSGGSEGGSEEGSEGGSEDDDDKKTEETDKETDKSKDDDKEKEKTEDEKKKEEEAKKPKAGEANFRCEKSGDTRPDCNEGLCCGAAKKEGGTDVIESCQKKDATVYKHKKDKDAKEEDWAFACIEGARSLTASATAVLAAAYMLA